MPGTNDNNPVGHEYALREGLPPRCQLETALTQMADHALIAFITYATGGRWAPERVEEISDDTITALQGQLMEMMTLDEYNR